MATFNMANRGTSTSSITFRAHYGGSSSDRNAIQVQFYQDGSTMSKAQTYPSPGSKNWTTNDVTATGLRADTSYDFSCIFYDSGYNPIGGTSISIRTDRIVLPNPTTPSSVSVSSITKDSAYASWDSSSYATEYEYQFLENGYIIINHGWTDSRNATASGLRGGTNYTFRVRGVNDAGNSSWATRDFTTTQPIPPPNRPTSVSVTGITHNSATITASSVSDATRYNLVVSLSNGGEHVEQSSTSRIFYIDGLSPNTTYEYGVSAENSNGTSGTRWASPFTTSSLVAPSLSVSNPTMTSLDLSVSGGSSGLYGYYYSRREWYPSTSSWSGWTQMYFSYGTSVTATDLSANTTYEFKVYGITDGYKTPDSDTATGTTLSLPTPTVSFGTKTLSSVIVSITTSVTATSYGLQRRDNIDYTWVGVLNVSQNTTVTGLINGRTYDFRARIYSNGGWSEWGTPDTVNIGSPRPEDWIWDTRFRIYSGGQFFKTSTDGKTAYLMTAVHWNAFTDRIILFRKFKTPTNIPTFTEVTASTNVSGILSAINQAIREINVMGFYQPELTTLNGLKASVFILMVTNLNSLK